MARNTMHGKKVPIFKTWWFWIIIILFFYGFFSGLSGKDEEEESEEPAQTEESAAWENIYASENAGDEIIMTVSEVYDNLFL